MTAWIVTGVIVFGLVVVPAGLLVMMLNDHRRNENDRQNNNQGDN